MRNISHFRSFPDTSLILTLMYFSGVSRSFFGGEGAYARSLFRRRVGGVQQIQLKIESTEIGDLGAVAP
jgi:hypothetical protein